MSLEQIQSLVLNIPTFFNADMRETMKNITRTQEKTICNKIVELNPVDIFEELAKISPDFNLKGLSLN